MPRTVSEWTDAELTPEEIQQCHSWDPLAVELAAEVLRLRDLLDRALDNAEACMIERDAALSQLRSEQALRDHAEAHIEYLKDS
jgi:hypothetical protein